MQRAAASCDTKLIVTYWYKPHMRAFILMGLFGALLSGCGYKGALYVPAPKADVDKPGTLVTPEPAPQRPVPAQSSPRPK